MTDFPGKGRVAVLKTSPQTVLEDYRRLMEMAGYQAALKPGVVTALRINISWDRWYPACSTAPWQLEGVVRTLKQAGHTLLGVHNDTVVVNAGDAELINKHKFITDAYGIPCTYTFRPDVRWVRYEPKQPLLILDKVFADGVYIPDVLIGKNVVHLPTMKTHVFTTITGAMKNAFGGLLARNRHWTHADIHATLVDLLQIQQDIHPGIFAVMDGTFAGDGPGPRAMRWHEKDIILASADQVAIDAVSARLQGFDPLSIPFIRKAHERGFGVGDPREIEIVGYDIAQEPAWNFKQEDTFASRGQKMIYHGALKPLEHLLLRTPLVPWSYFASDVYHNVYWYPVVGKPRVQAALQTRWGRKFAEYGDGKVIIPGPPPKSVAILAGGAAGLVALIGLGAWLIMRRG